LRTWLGKSGFLSRRVESLCFGGKVPDFDPRESAADWLDSLRQANSRSENWPGRLFG